MLISLLVVKFSTWIFILLQNFASNKLNTLVKFVVNPISVGKFLLETNTFKYRYIFRRIQPF